MAGRCGDGISRDPAVRAQTRAGAMTRLMVTAPATAVRTARWTARQNADATAAWSRVHERRRLMQLRDPGTAEGPAGGSHIVQPGLRRSSMKDRKSTRLNSSHVKISYAVFCLKKKK